MCKSILPKLNLRELTVISGTSKRKLFLIFRSKECVYKG